MSICFTYSLYLLPCFRKQEGCSDVSNNSEEVVLVDPGLEDDSFFKNKTKKQSRNEGNSHKIDKSFMINS